MLWINQQRRSWRTAFLVLLVIALSGPWFFGDRIHVPSPYSCQWPYIRLDEILCAEGRSVIIFLIVATSHFINIAARLVTGAMVLPQEWRAFPWFMLLVIPAVLLPFLTTLNLILRGEYRRRRMLHMVVLGLAAGLGLIFALLNVSIVSPALWGVWLFIGLATGMLLWEALAPRESDRLKEV
jgi:hypothetical protein